MAQLPPDGTWLIQQRDGIVHLFHCRTEAELIRFDPADRETIGGVVAIMQEIEELTPEQRAWATFWAGYFYAHAGRGY
jgi:hypothetical protein